MTSSDTAQRFLSQARHHLNDDYLPKIRRCLEVLSREDIWWRAHENTNSIGNLVLHLCGNVRQWIVSGLGGEEDRRRRPTEFSRRLPLPKDQLLEMLEATVQEATQVLDSLTETGSRNDPKDSGLRHFRAPGCPPRRRALRLSHGTDHLHHSSAQERGLEILRPSVAVTYGAPAGLRHTVTEGDILVPRSPLGVQRLETDAPVPFDLRRVLNILRGLGRKRGEDNETIVARVSVDEYALVGRRSGSG